MLKKADVAHFSGIPRNLSCDNDEKHKNPQSGYYLSSDPRFEHASSCMCSRVL